MQQICTTKYKNRLIIDAFDTLVLYKEKKVKLRNLLTLWNRKISTELPQKVLRCFKIYCVMKNIKK